MMRKARLAIRKVNVALDSPGYCFGTGRSLKLVCFPALTHVLPLASTSRFAHLCRSRPRDSVREQLCAIGSCYLIFARTPSISSLRKARMVWVSTFPNELTLRAKAVMVSSSGASNTTTPS